MNLRSDAFENGGEIPQLHSCEGQDISPGLSWDDVPSRARALALVCEDPDAPIKTFTHWLLYEIPAGVARLAQGLPPAPELAGVGRQGVNGFGTIGYRGPCPPTGPFHRYYLRLYALDQPLGLEAGLSKRKLLKAMGGHVLATAQLMGRYRKVPISTFAKTLLRR